MGQEQVRVIGTRDVSAEEERHQRLQVLLRQAGGDPSSILELLATIVRRKDWLQMDDGHGRPMGMLAYFRQLGWSRDDLSQFVERAKHRHELPPKVRPDVQEEMRSLRIALKDLLNPALKQTGGQEGNQNAAQKEPAACPRNDVDSINIVLAEGGTSSSYIIRRLRRDSPELAEKVILGQLTPNAAAIQAGFRIRTLTVPAHPQRAARILVKHLTPADVKALIIELSRAAGFSITHD